MMLQRQTAMKGGVFVGCLSSLFIKQAWQKPQFYRGR